MKKILLAAIIAVTSANTFADTRSSVKRTLCVNLMQMAEHLSKGETLGMPKEQLRPMLGKMPELHTLLDLVYHPKAVAGDRQEIWEFVYDHCESAR